MTEDEKISLQKDVSECLTPEILEKIKNEKIRRDNEIIVTAIASFFEICFTNGLK